MTTYETLDLWATFGAALASVGALLVLVRQVRILREQVSGLKSSEEKDFKQRRGQATVEFAVHTFMVQENLRRQLPDDRDSEAIAALIAQATDPTSNEYRSIVEKFSLYEALATGINHGVFDFEVAFTQLGDRLYRGYDNYLPWIKVRKELLQSPLLYDELRKVADRARERRQI